MYKNYIDKKHAVLEKYNEGSVFLLGELESYFKDQIYIGEIIDINKDLLKDAYIKDENKPMPQKTATGSLGGYQITGLGKSLIKNGGFKRQRLIKCISGVVIGLTLIFQEAVSLQISMVVQRKKKV